MKWRESIAWGCALNALLSFAVMPWQARNGTELAVFVGSGFFWAAVGWLIAPSAVRSTEDGGS